MFLCLWICLSISTVCSQMSETSISDFLQLISSPGWSINCVKCTITLGYFSLGWPVITSRLSGVCVCDSVMISVPPQAWEMSFLTVPDMPVSSALTVCLKMRRVWKSCQSQSCLISDGPKPQTAVCSWGNWKMLVFSWTFIGNCNPNLKLFWNTHTSWRLNTGCDYTVTPLKDWCIL